MKQKNIQKKWEVPIIKLGENGHTKYKVIRYKVTRRLAEMSVAETKIFRSKEEAKAKY